MKRVCLLSLNDRKGFLDGYVRQLINEMKKVSVVYTVCRAEYESEAIPLPKEQIIRCPHCYTEATALQYALLYAIGKERINEFDELLLVNDSFFGPFVSVHSLLRQAEELNGNGDFWGLVAKAEDRRTVKFCRYKYQPWYLHTSFLVIRQRLLHADSFWAYWEELKKYTREKSAVQGHDYAFSKYFQDEGFEAFSLYEYGNGHKETSLVFDSLSLLRQGLPILPKTVFTVAYDRVLEHNLSSQCADCIRFLREYTDYDLNLVYDAIIRQTDPYQLSCTLNANYVFSEMQPVGKTLHGSVRAAVVVFIGCEEQIKLRLTALRSLPEWIEVFITTNAEVYSSGIAQLLESDYKTLRNRTVILTSNGHGRDIASFLVEARPYLRHYDYLGFVPGSSQGDATEDEYWLKSLIGCGGYVEAVLSAFESNPRLGLLCPPRLEHGKHFSSIGRGWTGTLTTYDELCQIINIPNSIKSSSPPMLTNFAFWCRCEALEPLFAHEWAHEDFPAEPIGRMGTIYHAIARAAAYICKEMGFYSGIVCPTDVASIYINNRGFYLTTLIPVLSRFVRLRGSLSNGKRQLVVSFRRSNQAIQSAQNALARFRWRDYLKKQERKIHQNEKIIQKSRFFDEKWYIRQYPAVKRFRGSAAEHYLTDGWKQGKDPSPQFSTREYLKLNPGVARAGYNPLLHYETHGILEGRKYRFDEGGYHAHHIWRGIKRNVARILYRKKIKENGGARILVILHLFYMSSWKEIKEYLLNLRDYHYDLIVTYTDEVIDTRVLEDVRLFKPDVVMIQRKNIGFDVIPYLEVLQGIDTSNYDVIFKLQSKGVRRRRIFIYRQYFCRRDWFLNLFEGCIGAFSVHETIDTLMDSDNKVGIVAAQNLLVKDPPHKLRMVESYMKELGMVVPAEYCYVAGTCFAERAIVAEEVKKIPCDLDAIKPSGRGFSVAHKLERIICLTACNLGYELSGNRVMRLRRFFRGIQPGAIQSRKFSPEKVWNDDRFDLDDEFVYFSLEMKRVIRYELVDLPLQDIRRQWLQKPIKLKDCLPYKYLVTGDSKVYDKYCKLNKKHYNLDIMSKERFDTLIRSLEETSFDKRKVIVVNQDNILLDGQHRCCYMLYKYGEEYKVPALRIYLADKFSLKSRVRRLLETRLPPKAYVFIMHKYIGLKKLLLSLRN